MATAEDPSVRIIEFQPEWKSAQDDRNYRGIVLPNGLKALVVSDPATEKAAAALDVDIGSMCDPREVPGLAHFLEHMIFMGSEKYPQENGFEKFVAEHGGSQNAYTAEEHTNYHFDVAADFLEEGLDRFAQFFITPLLTETATEREVNAVNSEHENNVANDGRRLDYLLRWTADPAHPYNHFGTGNKDTLWNIPRTTGVSVRDKLLDFHDEYYSANIMSLAVIGKESLDALTDMVVRMFTRVPNKNVKVPYWDTPPNRDVDLKTRLRIVPISECRAIGLTWTTPDYRKFYHTKPGDHLANLVGHEGPGSLLSALRRKGWSSAIQAGPDTGARGFQFFTANLDLTVDGLEHVDEVVAVVFGYLNMLRNSGPQEAIWREEQQIADMQFRFQDKADPMALVEGLAANIHDYPLEEVLTGPEVRREYKPDVIMDLLSHLTADNVRISTFSKSFEEVAVETEPIYGTKYSLEKVHLGLTEVWRNVEPTDGIALPPANEYIPGRFDLLTLPSTGGSFPVLIRKTDSSRLWYLQDIVHKQPKASAKFELCSSNVYKDAVHVVASNLYVKLLADFAKEPMYMAALAGTAATLLHSNGDTTPSLKIFVEGFDDKIDHVLELLLDIMVAFKPNTERFLVFKEQYGRELRDFSAWEPCGQIPWYFEHLLTERCDSHEDLTAALDGMAFERFVQLIPDLFERVYVEGFVYGNIPVRKARAMMERVEATLRSFSKGPPGTDDRLRLVQLEDGSHFVHHRTNNVHKSSCVQNYYQTASEDERLNMLVELFGQVISEPCFDVLRTKEQLGYIVFSSNKYHGNVNGLQITVQSDRSPQYCDTRIERFLTEMEICLENMAEKDFHTHVEALAVKLLEKPKTIGQQAYKYWDEIQMRQYNFDRDRRGVAILRSLTKDDLVSFVKDYLLEGGAKRKKLSFQITSTLPKGDEAAKLPETVESQPEPNVDLSSDVENDKPASKQAAFVEDVLMFRKSRNLAPFPPKYTDADQVIHY